MDEGAKRTYKPRSGKANANQDKYQQKMLDFIYSECEEELKVLGYAHLFNQPSEPAVVEGHPRWIKTYNQKQMDFMLQKYKTLGHLTAFTTVNDFKMSIRDESFNPEKYPQGRSFQYVGRHMQRRTQKTSKTTIKMSIPIKQVQDKITQKVELSNPTHEMLKNFKVDEKVREKMAAEKRMMEENQKLRRESKPTVSSEDVGDDLDKTLK